VLVNWKGKACPSKGGGEKEIKVRLLDHPFRKRKKHSHAYITTKKKKRGKRENKDRCHIGSQGV